MDALFVTPLVDGRFVILAGRSCPHFRAALGGITQCCTTRGEFAISSSGQWITEIFFLNVSTKRVESERECDRLRLQLPVRFETLQFYCVLGAHRLRFPPRTPAEQRGGKCLVI
jgi:hypothetical protein